MYLTDSSLSKFQAHSQVNQRLSKPSDTEREKVWVAKAGELNTKRGDASKIVNARRRFKYGRLETREIVALDDSWSSYL